MEPSTPAPLRPLTPRGQRTRERLLEAAREVFARDGYADAHILEITRTAGVSAGTFYTYFATKDELFHEVAAEVVSALHTAPREDREGTGDPAGDIEAALRAYVAACRRYARITSSIQQLAHVDPVVRDLRAASMRDTAARGAAHVRRLQAAGLADPRVDADAVASALQTMSISVVYEHLVLDGSDVDTDHLVATLTDVWARAIGLRGWPPV